MGALPPVPYQSKVQDQSGMLVAVWADWFKQLFARVGGNNASSNTELAALITALGVKTGVILDFGGSSAPTGYLFCDGSAVSRTTYAALFAVIGTIWGAGNGTTTFNVPDLRGRFSVGKNAATFSALAGTGGAETTALPDHAHSVSLTTGTPSGTTAVQAGATNVASSGHTHGVSGNTGSPTTSPSIAVLPPFVVVNKIIKT